MADFSSCYPLITEIRKRDNFAVVFRNALEDVAGKVDFSHVKSCVAFGTGSGQHEIEFARRLLPNLRSFTAVEPDPESVKALRASIQDGQLPGVETSVVETTLESWSGVDIRVDAVLFINMLLNVHADDRRALIQKLMARYLNDGGLVVICGITTSVPSSYTAISERLGKPIEDYDHAVEDLAAAGFRVVFEQDLEGHFDLSNPSDDMVKFIHRKTGRSQTEVRAALDDVFSQQNMHLSMRKLGIFVK